MARRDVSCCVFCDREHKSREHVIPQWLGEPLRDSHAVAPGMRRTRLTHRYTPPAEVIQDLGLEALGALI